MIPIVCSAIPAPGTGKLYAAATSGTVTVPTTGGSPVTERRVMLRLSSPKTPTITSASAAGTWMKPSRPRYSSTPPRPPRLRRLSPGTGPVRR